MPGLGPGRDVCASGVVRETTANEPDEYWQMKDDEVGEDACTHVTDEGFLTAEVAAAKSGGGNGDGTDGATEERHEIAEHRDGELEKAGEGYEGFLQPTEALQRVTERGEYEGGDERTAKGSEQEERKGAAPPRGEGEHDCGSDGYAHSSLRKTRISRAKAEV